MRPRCPVPPPPSAAPPPPQIRIPIPIPDTQVLLVINKEPPFCDPDKDCPEAWSSVFVAIPCLIRFGSLALLASVVFDYLKFLTVDRRIDSGVPDELFVMYQSLWSRVDKNASGYVTLKSFNLLWNLVSQRLGHGPLHAGLTEFAPHLSLQEIRNLKYPVLLWPVVRLAKDRTAWVHFMDVCPACPCA